ncbi:MAG: hypothetical protein HKN09_00940, partial [Saprospiraceae bacterium]|nr:hypothetical protein [Saprospiraceae bacterium]
MPAELKHSDRLEKRDEKRYEGLEILYEDADIVAINKPHGLLVHRSPLAKDATEFAVQALRNQIGMHVYPCHRLDRKTSGVLLFAKNQTSNQRMQQMFREGKMIKIYHAIVRGFILDDGVIDYPLTHNDKQQEAVTHFKPLRHFEIPYEYNA